MAAPHPFLVPETPVDSLADSAPAVLKHEEDVDCREADRGDGEEAHGPRDIQVVLEEGEPGRRRPPTCQL